MSDAEGSLIPRRRVDMRALVMLLALAALLVGQSYLLRAQAGLVTQGKAIFVIGLVLAWAAAGPFRPNRAPAEQTVSAVRLRMWPSLLFVAALTTTASVYASRMRPGPDAPLLWLLGVATFVALPVAGRVRRALRSLRFHLPPPSVLRQRAAELAVFLAIFTLAVYLRTLNLTDIPPFVHDDEAAYGLDSLALRDGQAQVLFDNAWQEQPRMSGVPGAIVAFFWHNPLAAQRLSTVLTGLLTLPSLYLLARMYVGIPAAMLSVFLLAIAQADIHFSRQAMNTIQASPFTLIPLYFLLRALRRRSVANAVVCGLTGSLALYTYFSGRAAPIIIGVVFLFMMASDYRRWLDYLKLAVATAVSALVVFGPQLGFYLTHLSNMLDYQKTRLIWNQMPHLTGGNPNITFPTVLGRQIDAAFWGLTYYVDVTVQYGDRILDSVTGILFFVGLALCLRRWRHREHFMLLAWYVVISVFTGVIVISVPSAYRLCGMIPLTCLLAGVAVQRIIDIMKQQGRLALAGAGIVAFVVVPAIALSANYQSYFVNYVKNRSYEPQTELARYLRADGMPVNAYGVGTELDPRMKIVRFLAPNVTGYQMRYWDEYLPMRLVPQSDALFVGMDYYAPAVSILRDYYPGGTEAVQSTPQGRTMFVTYRLSAATILATKGLRAHYSSTQGEQQVLDRRDDSIDFDWNKDGPLAQAAFAGAWDGSLLAPEYGQFVIALDGSGDAVLQLDGREILRKAADQPSIEARLTLYKGWHVIHLEQTTSGGSLKLLWQRPNRQREVIAREFLSTVTAQKGLFASYYSGTSASGVPAVQALEPVLFSTLSAYADAQGGGKPWTGKWTGALTAPTTGGYTLGVRAHVGSLTLKVDGQTVLDFGPEVFERREAKINLSAGDHQVEIVFVCPVGRFDRVEFWWAPPGQSMTPVPPTVLTPATQ